MSYKKNKKSKGELVYIANIRLLTEKAHGVQVMKMCEAFSRLGLNVELWVPKRRSDIFDDPFEYYNIQNKFEIKKIPCLDFVFFDWRGIGFIFQTISFLFMSRIILLFRKSYPYIYTREPLTGFFFKDFYLELHSLPNKIKKVNIWLWSKSKKIIVITSFIKKELIQVGIKNDIFVASDGVTLEDFSLNGSLADWRNEVGLPLNRKIIMYSGSFYLYDWKGVDVFLAATKMLPMEFIFVLVGGSENEVLKLKEKWPQSNIIFKKKVRNKFIPIFLKSANVLVLPNKSGNIVSEKYTSPLKLFEYMASGVPIVASDLPSIRDILDENNAFLVEPNNPRELAIGIQKVIDNLDIAEERSARSLARVQKYSWRERAIHIVDFIKNA